MAAADLAPLSEASLGPVIDPDVVSSLGHLHLVGRPEREGIDGSKSNTASPIKLYPVLTRNGNHD